MPMSAPRSEITPIRYPAARSGCSTFIFFTKGHHKSFLTFSTSLCDSRSLCPPDHRLQRFQKPRASRPQLHPVRLAEPLQRLSPMQRQSEKNLSAVHSVARVSNQSSFFQAVAEFNRAVVLHLK